VLSVELDNLRSTAEWCIEGKYWEELAGMVLGVRRFLFDDAPTDAASWHRTIADHAEEVDPKLVADVHGELAWITVVNSGDRPGGAAIAGQSLEISRRTATAPSPWAYLTEGEHGLMTGDSAALVGASERALAVAEARHDETAATVALSYAAMGYTGLGDTDRADEVMAEAFRRGQRCGHRDAIQSATVTAATRHLWSSTPDFAASLAALSRYDRVSHKEDVTTLFLDVMWGATLIGLGRPGAVSHLC
jgi:hypothetical protein